MSRTADNDINPKSIINHTRHPYLHPHPQPFQHGQQQCFDHPALFNSNSSHNTHHPSTFPVISPDTRPPLNLGAPSYTAITSGAPVEQGAPSTTSATDLSHKPIWASEPETLRRQEGNLIGATQS